MAWLERGVLSGVPVDAALHVFENCFERDTWSDTNLTPGRASQMFQDTGGREDVNAIAMFLAVNKPDLDFPCDATVPS